MRLSAQLNDIKIEGPNTKDETLPNRCYRFNNPPCIAAFFLDCMSSSRVGFLPNEVLDPEAKMPPVLTGFVFEALLVEVERGPSPELTEEVVGTEVGGGLSGREGLEGKVEGAAEP